jgi:CheY-like chemotaxis protein
MSDAVRRHIFEPFFTTKSAGGGTGLGLPMVYGFVEQSGGQIEVESREGKGTCFLLSFPAVAAPIARAPRPAPSPLAQKRACKVLLVDDNAALRQTLCEQILSLDCAVVEAADYAQAVAALGADPEIDFILTDLDLGDGPDGIALVRWVRDNGRTLPGAIISGHLKTITGLPTNWQSLAKPIQLAQLKALLATELPLRVSGRPLILVVEDHDDMRFIATETLKRRGYGVIEAASAQGALDKLKSTPGVALVLSDVGLPDMTGGQLADEIGRLYPGLTVLLMSGSLSQREYNAVGDRVLQKPFTRESLTRFVEDALARGTASQ